MKRQQTPASTTRQIVHTIVLKYEHN